MSELKPTNNKRIAKNTLLLYFRMLFMMAVSLYTSRVVLKTLGVIDYGIYNVVGGVVAMFAFLNNAMAGATQRFLNFDLAKNDEVKLSETFNTSILIHFFIVIIVVIAAETIGLWFLYNKMVIPEDRYGAALWVFQCSLLSMAVNIMSAPYNAAIIAHEKMNAFAYISLLEAGLKLAIVYMLFISEFDKLKVYATLLLCVSVLIRFVYSSYSKKNFKETKFRLVWNVDKLKKMGSFASWNLIGNLALMGVTQGLNMVLNIYFGPAVNAARGVAVQVQNAVLQFASSFQTAINPQITKSFAVHDFRYMYSLVCRGAKFSFFLVFILSLPILIMTDQILNLWLVAPPLYSSSFLRIIIITILIDCLSNPLNNAINASGKIKSFQLTNGFLMLMVIPVSIVVLSIDANPCLVFIVQLLLTLLTHFFKLRFAKVKTMLPIKLYAKKVYFPCVVVAFLGSILPYFIYQLLEQSIFTLFFDGILSLLSVGIVVYFVGFDANEKNAIQKSIHSFKLNLK